MRPDLGKVLTEKPRRGSGSKNNKTRFRENGYDDREAAEEKYSLPKIGKMLMHNRDNGPWDETKEFTDVLGPLKKWAEAQVGRNWDKVYSEIRKTMPNNNMQNHHIIDTHLLGYFHRDVEVVKDKKRRRVYDKARGFSYGGELRELYKGELYVDPDTKVIMKVRLGAEKFWLRWKKAPPTTATGYPYVYQLGYGAPPELNKVKLGDNEFLEKRGDSWVYCKYEHVTHKLLSGGTHSYDMLVKHHTLSRKELKKYGVSNVDDSVQKKPNLIG